MCVLWVCAWCVYVCVVLRVVINPNLPVRVGKLIAAKRKYDKLSTLSVFAFSARRMMCLNELTADDVRREGMPADMTTDAFRDNMLLTFLETVYVWHIKERKQRR